MLTPRDFRTSACPTYPEIRLSLFPGRGVARAIARVPPQALHIATEGPLGIAARRYCVRRGMRFTTSYHTQFPQYLRSRFPIPLGAIVSRPAWFHGAGVRCMVSTPDGAARARVARLQEPGALAPWRRYRSCSGPRQGVPRTAAARRRLRRAGGGREEHRCVSARCPGTAARSSSATAPSARASKRNIPDVRVRRLSLRRGPGAHLAAADVMVFPSRTDTFGLVNLEAMACGVPVAAYPGDRADRCRQGRRHRRAR